MLTQEWARGSISLGVGESFMLEPTGWRDVDGNVYDHMEPGCTIGEYHRGTDFPLDRGTPITCALGGTVTWADWSNLGYGYLVTVQGARYKARYAHLSEVDATLGAWIHAGDLIGLSGASGNVTGPHLHFEVYDMLQGRYVNPFAR